MQNRAILHSDLNSFFASVEIMLDPSLRGKAVAVCGATEDRHGIVLAKSETAKKAGVKTGMVNWEARQLCPDLVLVSPHYEQYLKYSALVRKIYLQYSDLIEPFGMDECWIDVTGSCALYGSARQIAEDIRRRTREELGLTVSIGVSFNKVFAKLGSDLKKPDAITEISQEDFPVKLWPLPASDMIYIGPSTAKKLAFYNIHTLGDLAHTPPAFLRKLLGINGERLWLYANGQDHSPVMPVGFVSPLKTIGHGTTCTTDLATEEEVKTILLYLSQDVSHRLHVHELAANGVQITVRDSGLGYRQYQGPLLTTQDAGEIAQTAFRLFQSNYPWLTTVRSLTVRAISLSPQSTPRQTLLFDDIQRRIKREIIGETLETIHGRFGKWSVYPAALLGSLPLPDLAEKTVTMPKPMYRGQ